MYDFTEKIKDNLAHLQNEEDLGRLEMMIYEIGESNLLKNESSLLYGSDLSNNS
jgi:hypothetical protein